MSINGHGVCQLALDFLYALPKLLNLGTQPVPLAQELLLTVFAVMALALTAVGLYGVVAFGVVRQTREFGIRIALGARRSEVMKLVLRTALRTSAVGITIGVVAAVFTTPLLGDALYGVRPLDPATFVIVVTTLVLVSLLASWIPARRATRVDPMLALRTE